MAETDSLMDEVASVLRSQNSGGRDDEHPPVEDLVAYHEGSLPEARQEALQEHLIHCQECAKLVLDFAQFENLGPPSGKGSAPEPDLASLRQSIRERLEAESASAPEAPTPFRSPRRSKIPPGYWIALAATLILLVGVVTQLLLVSGTSAGATEILPLEPDQYREEEVPQIPSWAETVVLSMATAESLGDTVVAELQDVNGRRIAGPEELSRATAGTFNWPLRVERLPPGMLRVQLFSPEGEPLDSYHVELVRENPSD